MLRIVAHLVLALLLTVAPVIVSISAEAQNVQTDAEGKTVPAQSSDRMSEPRFADLEPWLDGFMRYSLESGQIAGAVVTLVSADAPILEKGYGYADLAAQRRVDTETTLFRIGSVSKLMTWTAVLQQVEIGVLDLDADINEYLDFTIAPETAFPGPLEDAIAALEWLHANADLLGIDANRIAIGGESAGGGLTAQLAIAARDRNLPVVFQVLIYPMLDDRTGSSNAATSQVEHYVWNAASNRFAWSAYLGQPAGADEVPYGAVPARVESLTGLAPAWIGVGSVDLFAEESMIYAMRLERSGVPVDLVVVPGGYHGFDVIAPQTELALTFTASWQTALAEALRNAEDGV